MIKKILIFVFLFFSFLSFSYWEVTSETQSTYDNALESLSIASDDLSQALWAKEQAEADRQRSYDMMDWNEDYHDANVQSVTNNYNANVQTARDAYDQANREFNQARENYCAESWDCLDQSSFMIDTNDFVPGGKSIKTWSTAKENINKALWTIIQKLMVALWILSLFIMTIWAWYIILYHGQDELLSKWKSIFMSGIIALVVALTSYYLVSLVTYILYN